MPEDCSFWDLHVAIQDAMGWLDCHLHLFRLVGSEAAMGIPSEDGDDSIDTRPGWEFRVRDFLSSWSPLATYEYDFGDSWIHEVRFEDIEAAEKGVAYPRCVAGARGCPPEDVGGVHGYEEFLRALADRSHPEHEVYRKWSGGSFDPEDFDPAAVRFDNPAKRWRQAFESVDSP
jgi:hypothetical protein